MYKKLLPCMALYFLSAVVIADVVELNNGDRFSGKLLSMVDGKVEFESPIIGKITVPMAEIRSLSTDGSAELHLKDGTVLKQAVQMSTAGSIETSGSDVIAGQPISLASVAQINPPPEKEPEWKGHVSSGINLDRGNTVRNDFYLSVNVEKETEVDRIILDAEYNEKREENPDTGVKNTSKRRSAVGGHYDYFVSARRYLYVEADAEKEATEDLDLRLTIGVGMGYQWIETDKTLFEVETGLGWVNENFSDATPDNQYASLRLGWKYRYDINENNRFFHKGEWFPSVEDFDDQLAKLETGIRSRLNPRLSLEAKIRYEWDQTPAQGQDKNDYSYIFALGWDF